MVDQPITPRAEPDGRVADSAKPIGAQTVRGRRRRALILKVAAELFAERGYDSVSINDIGAAAGGVTGPALYRYFRQKEDILVSIYGHVVERHRHFLDAALASGGEPRDVLYELIDLQIELATSEPEKIRIYSNEERHLPAEMRSQLAAQRRESLRAQVGLLRSARPDLTVEQVEITVHALLALINSISLRRNVETLSAESIAHLRHIARQVLFDDV